MRGRDIKRYSYEFAELYLIATFPSKKYDIENYPAIKEHLLSFDYNRLKQTGEDGARKKTNNQWFETQDSIGYWEDFYRQKIVWASVGETYYSIVDTEMFLLDTNYFFTSEYSSFLIGILNSKLIRFWINSEDTPIGSGGAFRHYKYNLEKLSVPKLLIEEQKEFIELNNRLIDNQLVLKKELLTSLEDELNKRVYKLYGLTEKEIEFINQF